MNILKTYINDSAKESIMKKELHTLYIQSYDFNIIDMSFPAHQKVALKKHFFADHCEETLKGFRDYYVSFNDSTAKVDNAYVFDYSGDMVNIKCYVGKYFVEDPHCDKEKCTICGELDAKLIDQRIGSLIIIEGIEEFSLSYEELK